MKEYILKIVGVSLLAAFSEQLCDDKWRKYINLLSGFMIITVLLAPFTYKKDIKIFDDFALENNYPKSAEEIIYKNIKSELENKVSEDIKRRVAEEFSQDVEATVSVLAAKDGKIDRVEKISLRGKKNPKITDRLKFIYGADEVTWLE